MPSLTVLLLVHGKVTSRVVSRYSTLIFYKSGLILCQFIAFLTSLVDMGEEKRYFSEVYQEPFTPDQVEELDPTWRQMAVDLLMENPQERYLSTQPITLRTLLTKSGMRRTSVQKGLLWWYAYR